MKKDTRRLERTDVPGVYRRGRQFVAVYRWNGRQVKRYFDDVRAAIAAKKEADARRVDARHSRAETVKAIQHRRERRAKATVEDAYADLRRCLSAIDQATGSAGRASRVHLGDAVAHLHRAEDSLVLAIRCERGERP